MSQCIYLGTVCTNVANKNYWSTTSSQSYLAFNHHETIIIRICRRLVALQNKMYV